MTLNFIFWRNWMNEFFLFCTPISYWKVGGNEIIFGVVSFEFSFWMSFTKYLKRGLETESLMLRILDIRLSVCVKCNHFSVAQIMTRRS